MFMDEERDERYVKAAEQRVQVEFEKHQASTRRLGLMVLLVPIAAIVWGIPLAVILWRAAIGN